MTPKSLFSGARKAVRLAREYELGANDFTEEWRVHSMREAKRLREQAAYYLRSRRWTLEGIAERKALQQQEAA